MPGEQAGTETVQENEDRLTLPACLVMDIDAVDLDKTAVRVGKLLRRYCSSRRENRDEQRPHQQNQQQDQQADTKSAQEAAFSHLKQFSF